VWHEKLNAFECLGCTEFYEVRSAARRTPAALAESKEMLIADHDECWKYSDAKMAADARKYRKAKTRRANLATAGLAAQKVSWRGRA
jgi:hypothetical protein